MCKVRWVGLDVHADTIAVAVAEDGGEVRSVGVIPNRPEAVRRLVKRVGGSRGLRVCYEAGPTGYVLYWQLAALGVGVRWWPRPWYRCGRASVSRRTGATPGSWRGVIVLAS